MSEQGTPGIVRLDADDVLTLKKVDSFATSIQAKTNALRKTLGSVAGLRTLDFSETLGEDTLDDVLDAIVSLAGRIRLGVSLLRMAEDGDFPEQKGETS